MPGCDKILGLYHNKDAIGGARAMQLRCVEGLGHDGECQFQVLTDGENKATGKMGVAKVIMAFRS